MQSSEIRVAFDRFSYDGGTCLDRHGFKCAFMALHGSKPAKAQWEVCAATSTATAAKQPTSHHSLGSCGPSLSKGHAGATPSSAVRVQQPDQGGVVGDDTVTPMNGERVVEYSAFHSTMQVRQTVVHTWDR